PATALPSTSLAAPRLAPIPVPLLSPSSARAKAAASSVTAQPAPRRNATSIRLISSPKFGTRNSRGKPSMLKQDYLRNGAAIYERSFAIIRAEADLSRFTPEEAEVAVRMIHAAGQVEVAGLIEFAPEFVSAARKALRGGAPILCDSEMVAHGVTRARLPAKSEVICTLRDPRVPDLQRNSALRALPPRSNCGAISLRAL